MAIKVGVVHEPLSRTTKSAMKNWLAEQLGHTELASGNSMPVQNFGLYLNGESRIIQQGYWQQADMERVDITGNFCLRLGMLNTRYPAPTKTDRLAIIGGIIGVFGLWDDLAKAYSQAVGRIILEAYNSCFLDMINAPQPAVKLAFSADKSQAAAQYRDDERWYLNNGEPVTVDETWNVVAA